MERINRAKAVRKNWKDLFRVDLALAYLDGRQNPGYPANEWITINKVYSHLKTTLPSLYKADPYFYVNLKRAFDPAPEKRELWESRGSIRQAMLNYLKAELNLKKKTRLSIQDAQFSYGVAKTHYKADIEKNPDGGKPMVGENDEILIDEETGEPLTEPGEVPINERYCIERIHPDDFLWDEDAGPLEDTWSWVAQGVTITKKEANRDRRFSKKALRDIEKRGITQDDEDKEREHRKKGDMDASSKGSNFSDNWHTKDKENSFRYWEIYDLKHDEWLIVAEEGVIPLMAPDALPDGIEKHPFSILRFTLRDNSPYPIPPISQGLDAQKEFNLARSRLLTHRKRFNRKYIVNPSVDHDERSKLESGEDGTIIEAIDPNAVTPIRDAPLDQQAYSEIGYLNQDMIELFGGQSDEARGIAGADSATQAGILDKRLEIKEGDAMSEVIDFVLDIARKLDMQVKVHISRDEAVRIKGPEGELWVTVRETDYDDIAGEFGYDVNIGSTIPQLPQMERTSWMAFLSLLGNFWHLMLSPTIVKKMADLHHIEDEQMVNELLKIGEKIMGGQVPAPGATGSQPGVGETRPTSSVGGQIAGMLPGMGGST